jgi:TRAP-type mannitol/chloroaromatic compound transport system substrate-binding protein
VNSLFVNIGGIMRDPIVASAALTEMSLLHCPECDAEFKEWNTRNLGSWTLPNCSLISKPEVRPLEDVSGLRVRSSGHTVTLASAIGALPTNMTYTEVYEGMQRNQIDCTFGSAVWLESLSLGDVAKNVLHIDAGAVTAPSTYNIREDLWQSLSPEDRHVFIDTVPIAMAGATFNPVNAENTVLETPGRNEMQLQPDDAMIYAIKALSEKDLDAAITKAEGAGVGNAADIAARFREVYARWDGLVTPDLTVDAYQALLKREIYDHYPIE